MMDVPGDMMHSPPILVARGHRVVLDRVRLMGVVNVTPDSFSDGGLYLDPNAAIQHGIALLDEGADIIDVGGMSTRPGAAALPEHIELGRVIPVISGLCGARREAIVSVDTSRAKVAAAALKAGAHIVNDVRGLKESPGIARIVADAGAGLILMHTTGPSNIMQQRTSYTDFPGDIVSALRIALDLARASGVAPESLAIDPGFGFGKTWAQNVALLRDLSIFAGLGAPLVAGLSRKSFLGWLTGRTNAADRDTASHAAGMLAVRAGVKILRVHDVAGAKDAVRIAEAVWDNRLPAMPECAA